MNKTTFLFPVVAAAALLAGVPAAKAAVTPLSTFNFDLIGFNLANSDAYFITPIETATFGATTTFTAAGYDGQDITITSAESFGATTTTDTFTLSTPTNFLTNTTINGDLINGMQFDLGDPNSDGGAVPVVPPISAYTDAGSVAYGTNLTAALTPNTMIGNGGNSYGTAEGLNTASATTAISSYTVHGFTYSITYDTVSVPEPSTWAMLGLGTLGAGVVAIRRRRGLI